MPEPGSGDARSGWRHHHHQQVGEGGVGGKGRTLLTHLQLTAVEQRDHYTDLTAVAAGGLLGEAAQPHPVLVTPLALWHAVQ